MNMKECLRFNIPNVCHETFVYVLTIPRVIEIQYQAADTVIHLLTKVSRQRAKVKSNTHLLTATWYSPAQNATQSLSRSPWSKKFTKYCAGLNRSSESFSLTFMRICSLVLSLEGTNKWTCVTARRQSVKVIYLILRPFYDTFPLLLWCRRIRNNKLDITYVTILQFCRFWFEICWGLEAKRIRT
jgi:hypothetical protein